MAGREVIDRSRRPGPGPAPQIRLPRFERFRLGNGLKVVAVRHGALPEISARVVLKHGSTTDPAERAGTALLTARALTEGTEGRSAGAVAEWLDQLGAVFRVDVDHDSAVLSLDFLSRVRDEALQFLAEVMTRPSFEAKEVERLRDERLDEIARGLDEPRVVAALRWNEANFGGHPYGMRTGGVEETVRRIDESVLRGFHARHYRPASATLVIVGDLPELDRLKSRLETAFAAWSGEPTEPAPVSEPQPASSRRLWAIQWPGPQTEIRIGGLGIARLHAEYATVLVMNAVLGGLFSSRINMNLREDKGWTYGAASRVDARKQRGPLYVATAVDAKASVDAVREILGEMERMKTEPPDEEELGLAINALTLSLPRLFETVSQVAGRVAHQVIYGLPDDYWETYAQQFRAVSRADVQRAAERLLDTGSAAIVVVGPMRDFHAELQSLGEVEIRDIRGRPASL
ncbi:MAG: insulinase family protein [Gemmatimonadota bacterium]|nr:MAG: insulinase family protein [Gemmatimonadota bacterium]